MLYKLMVKTHNITNKKYLCITKRKNWQEYTGSGSYWRKHLEKFGYDFSTELLYESDNYDEFILKCLFYSELYDVVLSEEFANQIPEAGYDSNEPGKSNFEIWWKYASEEVKKYVVEKRSVGIKENHWINSESFVDIKEKISIGQIEHWSKFTLDERREMTDNIRKMSAEFFSNKDSDRYIEYINNQSENTKAYYKRTDPAIISEKNRKQRLNTSEESKMSRINKIREVYDSGKHDDYFKRLSDERQGLNNPAAKIITWYGIRYTKSNFCKFLKENNISKSCADNILDEGKTVDCYREYTDEVKYFDKIVCNYCGKECDKNPSAFKRWHLENCKMKGNK